MQTTTANMPENVSKYIWRKELSDGSILYIDTTYLPGGERKEREYLVKLQRPDYGTHGICLLGENGKPKRWYNQAYSLLINAAMEEFPAAVLVEQIHET